MRYIIVLKKTDRNKVRITYLGEGDMMNKDMLRLVIKNLISE